jgi:hypothetical protein
MAVVMTYFHSHERGNCHWDVKNGYQMHDFRTRASASQYKAANSWHAPTAMASLIQALLFIGTIWTAQWLWGYFQAAEF